MHRTKTEAALAEAELAHADDPERAEVLRRARRFKASWIELAEALTQTKRSARWKEWGYDSFERYAREELRLKQETVDKLTGSFLFLKRRAPSVLSRDALTEPVPSYEAVDFLRRAEAAPDAPRDTVEEIRRRVLDEGAGAASVSRSYRDVVFPPDPSQRRARDVAGLKNVARRLRELLAESSVISKGLAADTARSLDRLLEALEEDSDQAA